MPRFAASDERSSDIRLDEYRCHRSSSPSVSMLLEGYSTKNVRPATAGVNECIPLRYCRQAFTWLDMAYRERTIRS